jgi:hypothetical protein
MIGIVEKTITEMIKEMAERTPQPADLPPIHWVEPRPKCSQCRDYEVMEAGDSCVYCLQEIKQGYQAMVLLGRLANGFEMDHGIRIHAVKLDSRRALCGAEPGRRSVGWNREVKPVTCPRCMKKLEKWSKDEKPKS